MKNKAAPHQTDSIDNTSAARHQSSTRVITALIAMITIIMTVLIMVLKIVVFLMIIISKYW